MKKTIAAIIATSLAVVAPFAAAQCDINATGEYAVRIKAHTIGAINQETFTAVESLLESATLDDLAKQNSPELRKLFNDHLVQSLAGGRVVCAEAKTGFFGYAKRVRLEPEGFSVWVREKDIAKID